MPKAALQGLVANAALKQRPDRLAELVQVSLGKLVERHPDLLPMAVELGATVGAEVMLAWQALHPKRQSPEAQAALNEALMRATIARARAESAANDVAAQTASAPSPRRRRAAL